MAMDESNESILDEYSPECSRCGRCCWEFEGQIHFQSSAPFLSQSTENNSESFHPWVQLYFRIFMNRKHDLLESSKIDSKANPQRAIGYTVPSKRQIWSTHPSEAAEFLPSTSRESPDCLFLDYENGTNTPFCVIHGQHPIMCDEYPRSKGYVCKNHPERKYTLMFLEYQRSKIGFAINVLHQIYPDQIQDPHSFDLLTLLMDFGTFSVLATQKFFQDQFGISKQVWNSMLENLVGLQLISLKDDQIDGISLKEIEYIVDRTIKERNWS
ncbi:MAG: hypothetical protein ACTSYI_12950 [Promethearchaeota archaeon]